MRRLLLALSLLLCGFTPPQDTAPTVVTGPSAPVLSIVQEVSEPEEKSTTDFTWEAEKPYTPSTDFTWEQE